MGAHDFDLLQHYVNKYEEGSYFANTKCLNLPAISIKFCSIFIFKESDNYSFMLIFNEADLKLKDFAHHIVQMLELWAIGFKSKLHASSAICGLESVADKDTQFCAV